MLMAAIALIAFFVGVSILGKEFGAGAREIGAGISAMLSPQIRPAVVPTIGWQYTPEAASAIDWWRRFIEGIGAWRPQLPGPQLPSGNGNENNAAGDENGAPPLPPAWWQPMWW